MCSLWQPQGRGCKTQYTLHVYQGWGLLKLRYFRRYMKFWFSKSIDYTFNHAHICPVSPQLSCGNTCQICAWYHTGNQCFDHYENWDNKERNEENWYTRWRHQMETFPALLAICAGNSPVTGDFPVQKPVTRSFDVFFDLRLNKQLSKQSWGWWFETSSRSLWRHCNELSPPQRIHDIMTWKNPPALLAFCEGNVPVTS